MKRASILLVLSLCILCSCFISFGFGAPAVSKPINPIPSDGATEVNCGGLVISWECSQPESFDLFFGTSSVDLPLIAENLTLSAYFDLDTLNPETTYYWRVDATLGSESVSGDLWSFTTWADTGDDDDDAGGGGGGCNAGSFIPLSLLLLTPLVFMFKK